MHYPIVLLTYLLYFVGLWVVTPVHGSDINQLNLVITQKQSTPESKQQAIAAGKERALLCSMCHGKDGNSVKADVPNLAGQNTVYLLDQIEKFSDGRRKNYVMNSLAKNFTTEDKINLAIFYNNMHVKQIAFDKELAEQGRKIYEESCSLCHGKRGRGSTSFARIAGQKPNYVFNTLKQFRDSTNKTTEKKPSKRSSKVMEPIVQKYSDRELKIISAYVAQLQ